MQYNKGRKEAPDLKIGSRVLVNPHSLEWKEAKGEGKKLVQRWIGPFEVVQKINPKVYRLRMNDRYPGTPVFNIEHLKPYQEPPAAFGVDRTTLPEMRNDEEATEEFPVERIIGHRRVGKKKTLEFLLRWEGYGPQFDTWQTARDLKNAHGVLAEYKKKNNL
jgi:hypothetical protein